MAMICFLCASEVELRMEVEEGRVWRCDCGKTKMYLSNKGALDLGPTDDSDPDCWSAPSAP